MALEVRQVHQLALEAALGDGPGHLVLLDARVRHGAVVVGAVGVADGRAVGGRLVDAAIRADRRVRDVGRVVELRRVEGLQRREGQGGDDGHASASGGGNGEATHGVEWQGAVVMMIRWPGLLHNQLFSLPKARRLSDLNKKREPLPRHEKPTELQARGCDRQSGCKQACWAATHCSQLIARGGAPC